MFLTDQYEATAKLMVRLATVLRYISGKARELAEEIHTKLLHEKEKNINSELLDEALDDIRRLRLHAKELQTLLKRAAISRYKDHGDLLKRIMSEMKLDQMADLLDQQLQHLSELYGDILRKVEERRESKANLWIQFLTAVVGFSAIKDLSEAFAEGFPSIEMNKNYLTLGLFFLAVSILIYFTYKWRWKK
jgi:hypothetical protein